MSAEARAARRTVSVAICVSASPRRGVREIDLGGRRARRACRVRGRARPRLAFERIAVECTGLPRAQAHGGVPRLGQRA